MVEVTHDPLRILKLVGGVDRRGCFCVEVTHDPLRILKHLYQSAPTRKFLR